MLFKKKPIRLFFLISLLFLTACQIYNTLELNPDKESIEACIREKEIIVIHDDDLLNEFELTSIIIENGSLKGVIKAAPEGPKHPPHPKGFPLRKAKAYGEPTDVMHIYSSEKDIKPGPISTPINSIKSVEVHEYDMGPSALATIGLIGLVGVGTGVAYIAIACNCPQVATYNGSDTNFHGALFPGAIFQSLKRDDYLILKDPVISDEGELNLRISNEKPESQFIDQLEVLEVNHEGYSCMGLNNNHNLVAYNTPLPPVQAIAGNSKDISDIVSQEDDESFDFNQITDQDQLCELTLRFDRSKFSQNPVLVIRGQQTEWLDTVATFIYAQAGKHEDKWLERKDDISPEKWEKINAKRGLSLNVYIKNNNVWEYAGSHHYAGTSSKRNLLMELDISGIQSPLIEIKLESAFKIWEIDYAGLSDSWTTDLAKKPLKVLEARTMQGEEVTQLIQETDDDCLIQKELGSYVDLQLEAVAQKNHTAIVLHGSGYYHIDYEFDNKMNLGFFLKFNGKTGFQNVSVALHEYKKQMTSLDGATTATASN